MKILILGNDKTLTQLKPTDIPNDVITVGINRAYLHMNTSYISFTDVDILNEMIDNNIDTTKYKMVCSDRLITFYYMYDILKYHKIEIIKRSNPRFVYSVDSAIDIFDRKFPGSTFYLYATSMKYDSVQNHFWTGVYKTTNKNKEDWYIPRFSNMIQNIEILSRSHKIYSCTKDSVLNNFLKYKDVTEI